MFLLNVFADIGSGKEPGSITLIVASILALAALIVGLCGWAYATHTDGVKGFAKGATAVLLAWVDYAFILSFYKSIGSPTLIGGVIAIILLIVLHVFVINRWFTNADLTT